MDIYVYIYIYSAYDDDDPAAHGRLFLVFFLYLFSCSIERHYDLEWTVCHMITMKLDSNVENLPITLVITMMMIQRPMEGRS